MGDYPDYTDLVQLVGSDIMMPVDIQAQYVTLEIDIVAQSVGNIAIDVAAQTIGNIGIDIKAQTLAQLNINLAASAITLNISVTNSSIMLPVDIQAQYLTLDINIKSADATVNIAIQSSAVTINMDIHAQSVGVYLKGEWESKEGNFKSHSVAGSDVAPGTTSYADYTVPAGKTFYMCSLSASSYATNAADKNSNQIVACYVMAPPGTLHMQGGGNGGYFGSISPPVRVSENVTIRVGVYNGANHNVYDYACVLGYEV